VADSGAANGDAGGDYRLGEADVGHDLTDGRYFLGWHRVGEWREYKVDLPAAGSYCLIAFVASTDVGGKFSVFLDGQTVASGAQVPDTGSFNVYQQVSSVAFSSVAGQSRVLRMVANTGNPSGYWVGDIDWLKLERVADGSGTTPPGSAGTLTAAVQSPRSVLLKWTDVTEDEPTSSGPRLPTRRMIT
jgi:hypothetical protein